MKNRGRAKMIMKDDIIAGHGIKKLPDEGLS